jgi:hypothetical protein
MTEDLLPFLKKYAQLPRFFPPRWKVFLLQTKIENIFRQRCKYWEANVNNSTGCTVQCDRLRGSEFCGFQNI